MVLDRDRHGIQFYGCDHSFSRVGVVVILGSFSQGDLEANEPSLRGRVLRTPVPGGPGVDHYGREVGNAAPVHRLLENGITGPRLLGGERLGIGESWLHVLAFAE